jgi:hypothetical protein
MSQPHLPSSMLQVAALLATACVPEFETDLSVLKEPRVLAISSSPAEASAQKELTLTALVAVPDGASTPGLDWTMCLSRKPLTELGPVNAACLAPDDGSGAVLSLGQGASVQATLDKDVCKLFGPLRPSPSGNEGAGRPADPDITGGFYQPFVVRLGATETTLGSVRLNCDLPNIDRDQAGDYRQRYRANENPVISQVQVENAGKLSTWNMDELPSFPAGSRTKLRVSWNECSEKSECGDGLCPAREDQTSCSEDCAGELRGCTGAQPYVWYDNAARKVEDRHEGISIAWFASRGRFENEQTGLDEQQARSQTFTENTYIASGEGGPATIWLVIRDTRGGQTWETRHLEVER